VYEPVLSFLIQSEKKKPTKIEMRQYYIKFRSKVMKVKFRQILFQKIRVLVKWLVARETKQCDLKIFSVCLVQYIKYIYHFFKFNEYYKKIS
jgi:hypothetical protein